MALATQCPHCGTTFRVAHDQLKLRAGLVRCGACKEIFNGIEHLLHAPESAAREPARDDAAPPPQTFIAIPAPSPEPAAPLTASTSAVPEPDAEIPADATAPTAAPADDQRQDDDGDHGGASAAEAPAAISYPTTPAANAPESMADDPLQRMTLMDFAQDEEPVANDSGTAPDQNGGAHTGDSTDDRADELERAIEELQRKPLRRSRAASKESGEPDFMARARQQQRASRVRRTLLASASALLLLGALMQGAYAFRNQLAALFPQAKPTLTLACAALGCSIDLPRQIDSVTIESSELQALAPERNTFALSVLLRNRSATLEAWPNIELTLNDASEQPLVRRVFLPRDYLPPAQNEIQGFAAETEQPLRIYFELAAAKAAGYRIYLFYS